MQKGIFTISLDFELFWGVRDHRTLENYGENIRNVHRVIPRLLALFERYNVHCTWAIVGFIFFNEKKEMIPYLPTCRPGYRDKEYDPYAYLEQNELEEIYHFAPALIEEIKKTPGQEIGTHTFSHFYPLEKNTSIEQFRSDLQAAFAIAIKRGLEIKSIVFPRNQYSDEHIKVCLELGIKIYRGNGGSAAYKPVAREYETNLKRGIRFADSFINILGHRCHPIPPADEIINIPASSFLWPYNPRFRLLERLKFNRIKRGLEYAAEHGLIYQLWWHPHNFGKYMDENFDFLEKILDVYAAINKKQKMESLNLLEIYQRTKNR